MKIGPDIPGDNANKIEVHYYPEDRKVAILNCGTWVENYCQSTTLTPEALPDLIAALQLIQETTR